MCSEMAKRRGGLSASWSRRSLEKPRWAGRRKGSSGRKEPVHRACEIGGPERLRKEIAEFLARRSHHPRFVRRAREHDHRGAISSLAELFDELHAVHPFKTVVGEDDRETLLLEDGQRFFRARHLPDLLRAEGGQQ